MHKTGWSERKKRTRTNKKKENRTIEASKRKTETKVLTDKKKWYRVLRLMAGARLGACWRFAFALLLPLLLRRVVLTVYKRLVVAAYAAAPPTNSGKRKPARCLLLVSTGGSSQQRGTPIRPRYWCRRSRDHSPPPGRGGALPEAPWRAPLEAPCHRHKFT